MAEQEVWKNKKAHVLVVTIAFPGHFAPFVQLMYHLEAKYPRLTVTVMGNKDRIADLSKLQSKGELRSIDLRLEEVFGEVPVYHADRKFPVRAAIVSENNRMECESLRMTLIAHKDAPGAPTAIVSDMFQYWSKDLADELGIPWYTYFSVSSTFAVTIVESPKLLKAGVNPYTYPNPRELLNTAVPDLTPVPGHASVHVSDIPIEFWDHPEFFHKVSERTIGATAILLNTSEELDAPTGGAIGLRRLLKSSRVLPIGPSLQHPGFGFIYAAPTDSSNCLNWLQSQPAKSVLYIAFGSLGSISKEVITELAAGVEASGVPFLWVLKVGSLKLSEVLPPGFLERTRGRGLVETGWAPQSRILSHPSTGGFLTHCGWNSMLESICAGVPFIAWPLSADQPTNARFIADMAKIGFAICYFKPENKYNFDDITRKEVEETMRLLMLGEKGGQVRTNIEKMQKAMVAAVAKGGSSYQNLHNFLDELATT